MPRPSLRQWLSESVQNRRGRRSGGGSSSVVNKPTTPRPTLTRTLSEGSLETGESSTEDSSSSSSDDYNNAAMMVVPVLAFAPKHRTRRSRPAPKQDQIRRVRFGDDLQTQIYNDSHNINGDNCDTGKMW